MLLSLFILIFISIGPFFIRDILISLFFLPLRSIFPVNISLFVCFYVAVVVVAVSFFVVCFF